MAKRKDSLALFELISKERTRRGGIELPPRQDEAKGAPAAEPAAEETAVEPVAAAPIAPAGPPRPKASLAGARLELSLDYVDCCFVVAAVVLLLVAAFVVGLRSAPTAQPAPPTKQPGPAPFRPGVLGRSPGKHYLVIQRLRGRSEDDEDAERILAFLTAKGVYATKEPYAHRGGDAAQRGVMIWSLEGFGSPDSPDALAHAAKIHDLGRQYRAQGGDCDFKELKASTNQPLFIPYRP